MPNFVKSSTTLACLVMGGALAVGGCASKGGPIGTAPMMNVAVAQALPAPASSRVSAVQPFDKLRIGVFGVEELQRDVQVGGDGRFSFPLVGTIAASGRTAEDIAADITAGLRRTYMRNPHVTVNLIEPYGRSVTVEGQVQRPGRYPALEQTTMLDAIASAGGTTEFAQERQVLLFRNVDSHQYIGVYDLQAVRRGNYANPVVYPGDQLVVGDSPQRRLLDKIIKAAPLLTTPLVLLK